MTYEATIHSVGVRVGPGGAKVPIIILNVRDVVVPIRVGGSQARAIELARQDMPADRPLTHDLFAEVLADVNVTLDQIRIDDIADETFYAKLDLLADQADGVEKIVRDSRPSDAIALAVRDDCPILIADDVIDRAGIPPGNLGIDTANQQPRGPDRVTVEFEAGSEQPVRSEGKKPESTDLDDGVEIEFEDSEDSNQDTDPEA
jgi:bifunctional DNase/RNase